jgi:hypothetical protein
MISERTKGEKRPAWCINAIMGIKQNEFDKSELGGVQERATVCMSRNTLMFTRVKNGQERLACHGRQNKGN